MGYFISPWRLLYFKYTEGLQLSMKAFESYVQLEVGNTTPRCSRGLLGLIQTNQGAMTVDRGPRITGTAPRTLGDDPQKTLTSEEIQIIPVPPEKESTLFKAVS